MRVVVTVWVVVMAVCTGSKVKLVNNGYDGIVIGISSQIDQSQGPAIIAALKDMVKEGSEHLFRATRRRAFFRHVKLLIPQSWNNTDYDHPATVQTYQESEIRVDLQHHPYYNQPYTKQPGKCGSPGLHIHLTPDYLTEEKYQSWWGKPGKSLVPLWAKLRWGVFDELGYPNDPIYPSFYYLANEEKFGDKNLSYAPSYCANAEITGFMRKKNTIKGVGKWECVKGKDNLPEQDCRFFADKVQAANSSLLSYPFISSDSVVEFCDETTHLRNVPNKQNVMCRGQSVWKVMLQHDDFKNANPARDAPPEDPVITVIKGVYPSYAVVMDYSNSMRSKNRIGTLQRSVRRWLLYTVPTNSFVSLIRFSSGPAILLTPLTKITDMQSRRNLASKIDKNISGGTSIISGLQKAKEVLNGTEGNKNIFLITDGEDDYDDPESFIDDLLQANICVMTVALGKEADSRLESLSDKTGCKSYVVNDNDQTRMMNSAFEATLVRMPVSAAYSLNTKFYESSKYKTTNLTVGNSFKVDKTIGRNMVFHLETDKIDHVIGTPSLIDPQGNVIYAKDAEGLTMTWTITVLLAEVGEWRWEVQLDGDKSHWVQAFVTSHLRDSSTQPITVTPWTSAPITGVNAAATNVILFAEVTHGSNPIVGAQVRGTIDHPDDGHAAPNVYILKDDGKFADSVKNDGIYSAYMTNFSVTSRYGYRAEVVKNEAFQSGNTMEQQHPLNPEDYLDWSCATCMPTSSPNPTVTNFTREGSAGSFKVKRVPREGADILPPARVMDLQVESTIRNNKGTSIKLTWTAPGDDMDQGTVSNYQFQMSTNREDLSEAHFDPASPETLLPVFIQDLEDANVLIESGNNVTFNIMSNKQLEFEQVYFVGLRAVDDSDNESEVSNIVQFTFEQKLPFSQSNLKVIQHLRDAIQRNQHK
ncbi:calcium-activated chloride channel regulator 4-like [Homarus americanus]|uniref:calcium-activated chloride channel regulator 4-like n=1 Tax=Homarus americanus TaxID=6706 RepID=UPI001C46B207|nr:calcium-activated chloride channel regulator 4-like [Homarus americanus]XP_042237432.1 calcium-activated chloride channel regulator 4-like [Homarus americanus]